MAAITWNEVVELDASLASVPAGLQAAILGRVEELSSSFFGGESSPTYKMARLLLAAHLGLTIGLAGAGGAVASGPVTSRSEGGVTESYAVAASVLTGSHGGTSQGRAFDDLVRSRPERIGLTS